MEEKYNFEPRKGCVDVWNAFMTDGAIYSENDIPFCPTTAVEIPQDIITFEEARKIYKCAKDRGEEFFHYDAYVCFYKDDYKFDGIRGIWYKYDYLCEILRHFSGAITPDFSTYQDFPEPLKIWNTFRMRAYGYWLGKQGIPIINNVRWGTKETYNYCFDGLPSRSIVAIGTVGGSPRRIMDRKRFNDGFYEMLRRVDPKIIIVYGSASYPCFECAKKNGVQVFAYKSKTSKAFSKEVS